MSISKLNILIITQFFPPEVGAASVRISEFVNNWCEKSNVSLRIVTSFPNYLKGKLYSGYQNQLFMKEKYKCVELIRFLTFPSSKSIFFRILGIVVYNLFTLFYGLFTQKPDFIFATSPPLTNGVIALLLKKIRNIDYVFEVRDLYPESAIQFGLLKNRHLIRVFQYLENQIYRNATLTIAATKGIEKYINNISKSHKTLVITNGVNTDLFKKYDSDNTFIRNKYNWSDKFIVIYTGILGIAQNLETMINAANRLIQKKDIVFLFVGDGMEKNRLMQLTKSLGLNNVFFHKPVPYQDLPRILSEANVGFSSRKKVKLTEGALPVKVFEYMACELPVLVNASGEVDELIKNSGAGLCALPGDDEKLAKNILKLKQNKSEMVQMGKKGREYVERHFSRKVISNNLLEELFAIKKIRIK